MKLTLEIQAEANEGFADSEVSIVRDNARQLKFKLTHWKFRYFRFNCQARSVTALQKVPNRIQKMRASGRIASVTLSVRAVAQQRFP